MARFRLLAIACMVALPMSASRSSAAETLDAAVTNIAQKFAGVATADASARRVAVTAFAQSDRKTTQFTNLLMIALTGKMVENGTGKFRVIERAQLETALAEIQLSDVPIFDRNTARELGKFLGVDVLIVGEITPIGDVVRIDARMIDVETIETMEQASDWVPLTPSIQRQLDTVVQLTRPTVGSGGEPDRRNGVWNGTGTCGETQFGVAVSIVINPDNTITAMQTYYPLVGRTGRLQSGVLAMEGTIDPATGAITLNPGSWLYRPDGHGASGFTGTMDAESGTLRGSYLEAGCSAIELQRMR